MTSTALTPGNLRRFAGGYPAAPLKLEHGLSGHPLLALDALAELAGALPPESIEYNPGALPIGIAPEDVPPPALSVVETIRSIGTAGSWVVLKRVEQHPAYAALLDEVLADLAGAIEPRTGDMLRREAFVFVSSPGAVTPFHFDPEHNVLFQIAGSKTVTIFPAGEPAIAGPQVDEEFHLGQRHRNLPWHDSLAALGEPYALAAGEALHIPVKAPHWVENGPEVSVSLSVTWRSEWSFAEADAHAFNRVLRRLGVEPRRPAPFPAQNRAKALSYRLIRRVGRSPD
jgi:hypothetical protein